MVARELGDLCGILRSLRKLMQVLATSMCRFVGTWAREEEKGGGTALFTPGFASIDASTCRIFAGWLLTYHC
jgi:hypothetical protein